MSVLVVAQSSSEIPEGLMNNPVFYGLLTSSKRGNIAILVVLDAFSKFVSFYLVRKISSQVV